MHRGHAPPGGGFVHKVVVDQAGGVDHLGDLRQPPLPGIHGLTGGNSPGQHEHKGRAQFFAAGLEKMFRCCLEDGMPRPDQVS